MSSDAPAAPSNWPALSPTARRVLGVLVEKAKTTPDIYPLSLNALTTGCNQKSNREPVMNLSEDDVEQSLLDLLKPGLVSRVTGGRVERWRHHLYEVWNVSKVELAIVTELLLRGAQTEGELRGRASRMESIDDLDTLRQVLKPLHERGLIVYLGPEGRRGTLIMHGFCAGKELERLRSSQASSVAETAAAPAGLPDSPRASAVVAELRGEIGALRDQVTQLQQALASLTDQVRTLKEALGS